MTLRLPIVWVGPEDVPLEILEASELAGIAEPVRRALRIAHALAEAGVAYRNNGDLSRRDLDRPPLALSCSELVYYVFARSGLDLGDAHMRTRWLAYGDPQPYQPSMIRVGDGTIRPGDLLVYHRDRARVERELAERGRTLPGHVVIVVSTERRVVIGSHGRESTPEDGITGVGYRALPDGFERWTLDRTLRAVYRYWNPSDQPSIVPVSRA